MSRINVTSTFLPPKEEYEKYLDIIWQSNQLTNGGSLLSELEEQLQGFLEVENFKFVANGTLALQLSLQALDITGGEVITTPFTYVATASAILWQRCKPVFVDIDPETLCIDPSKIEAAITNRTKAIMPVHVFGNHCDIEGIEAIAKKHNLKTIYDAAHAFGVKYKGKSLLSYGDVSICSFHATKPFHTIEGGCVIARDKSINDKIELIKRFGHNGDEHFMLGINAKANEFQAAMGLCNLKYIEKIIESRKKVSQQYDNLLGDSVQRPKIDRIDYNYAYYPVILKSEEKLERVVKNLNDNNIFPRRYFYPSINTLPYIEEEQSCPISEDVSRRILCLPLYGGLAEEKVTEICKIMMGN